jgi:hypothetical protein
LSPLVAETTRSAPPVWGMPLNYHHIPDNHGKQSVAAQRNFTAHFLRRATPRSG